MNMLRRDLPAGADQQGQQRQQPQQRPAQPTLAARMMQQPSPAPARGVAPSPTMAARPAMPGQRPTQAPGQRPGPVQALGRQVPQRPKTDDLMVVMRQLTELLTKENLALRRHKTEEVKALTERKEQLARLYQSHMNAIHRDPSLVKQLDATRRAAIAQNAIRLGELMQDNASLLKANITSINMYFKAVTDALRHRQEEKAAAYSKSGAFNGYAVTKRSLAVTFNQTM